MSELSVAGDDYGRLQSQDVAVLARHRLDRFMRLLVGALAEEETARLLCKAGVQVRIDLQDLPETSVTLLLDNPPARVVFAHPQRPDVVLRMWSADLETVLLRGDYLPMQILSGKVEFEGYVRKLLRVMPILSGAVERTVARSGTAGPSE